MKKKLLNALPNVLLSIVAVCAVMITVKLYTTDFSVKKAEPEATVETPAFDPEEYQAYETPYGSLYYPSDYVAYLETEVTEADGVYAMRFRYANGEDRLDLYTVVFGDDTRGMRVGAFGDHMAASIEVHDVAANADWDNDEALRYQAMQEAVNDLIRSIERFENFTQA